MQRFTFATTQNHVFLHSPIYLDIKIHKNQFICLNVNKNQAESLTDFRIYTLTGIQNISAPMTSLNIKTQKGSTLFIPVSIS